MHYEIRAIDESEYPILHEFLYEAIFLPQGAEKPPKSVIELPELQIYISDFGKKPSDTALVAEAEGIIVGVAWARIMDDYGHIDEHTPSLAISLLEGYRNLGIGTALMKQMLSVLKDHGHKQVSLSVQKANYAKKLYKDLGFELYSETEEEDVMILKF
ncbi:MAG: N-acetyltransferase family protein [Anaerofustis sp.]